ncbi:trans-Golgi network integral membrane protein 1-like [Plakobranchus ocellatus]|uniref:Trans-Golgi network integral membrane protein 1-like n=1 Tax=Plakobranchus ocellatus TaxID=259542 RepID=A0AAV3ZWM1_9GAST|nr:trans-Golgi network integral membrane protein 1-like [Plakobranchus ocellatus]
MGYFNAKVGYESVEDVIRPSGIGTVNERGNWLIQWCQISDSAITNTWYQNHQGRQWTWKSSGDRSRNKIVLFSFRKDSETPSKHRNHCQEPTVIQIIFRMKEISGGRNMQVLLLCLAVLVLRGAWSGLVLGYEGSQPGGSRVESQNPATGSNFSPSGGQPGGSRAESQNPATGSNFSPSGGQPGGSMAESQNSAAGSDLSLAADQPKGSRVENNDESAKINNKENGLKNLNADSQVRNGGDRYGDVPSPGHFFGYFLTAVILCISGYVVYHNKQRIFAFCLEGRNGLTSRRKSGGAKYTKLQSNVEEVMPSLEQTSAAKNFVY